MELYKIQVNQGLYFLHEHPAGASSWKNEKVEEIMKIKNVKRVVAHMCQYGMTQEDENGTGWIKKPTAFMTNSEKIADRLQRKCVNLHRHIQLISGRAKQAEIYPDELCKQIVKGVVDQMREDGRIREGQIGSVVAEEKMSL